ncbi:MAG: hypothetical protein JSW05_00565 [Candidatus Thorarchaeota archaeon]|nr:MAG: hypothetical protein JSW05_00565 [Candidatus Thorarchaeota archaeon]
MKEIAMGDPKVFPSEDRDYAIAIRPEQDSNYVVRVLHCHPSVSVGQSVNKGDEIGTVLRSRFFCFWTGPHYHVEVMPEAGFHRSSISSPIAVDLPNVSSVERGTPDEIECKVVESSTDVLIGVSRGASYVKTGGLQGHLARAHGVDHVGILDAGIPHYEHGGVVGGGSAEKDVEVEAWSRKIGFVTSSGDGYVQFGVSRSFSPRVDGVPIRGISNHVYSSAQTVRGLTPVCLVPERIGQFVGRYDEGDVFVLSL